MQPVENPTNHKASVRINCCHPRPDLNSKTEKLLFTVVHTVTVRSATGGPLGGMMISAGDRGSTGGTSGGGNSGTGGGAIANGGGVSSGGSGLASFLPKDHFAFTISKALLLSSSTLALVPSGILEPTNR